VRVPPRLRSQLVIRTGFVFAATCLLTTSLAGQEPVRPAVIGSWDLTVITAEGRRLPSWLEVHWSGDRVLVGRFVGVVGSVRPVSRLDFAHDTLRFSLPPQWEPGNADFQFTAVFAGDSLAGSLTTADGKQLGWSGHRAPALAEKGAVQWAVPCGSSTGRVLRAGMWSAAKTSGRRSRRAHEHATRRQSRH